MADPGQYEAVLGQLSVFLVRQNARNIEIVDQGIYIMVSWQSDGVAHQKTFRDDDLARLDYARFPLGSSSNPVTLLAALGHELDRSGINVATVSQDPEGFFVTGSLGGHYQRDRHPYFDLRRVVVTPPPPPAPLAHAAAAHVASTSALRAVTPSALPRGSNASPIMRRLQALEQTRPH
jgi:hypothetical protein